MSDLPNCQLALGWRVSYQQYQNWRRTDFQEPRPVVERKEFASREEAEREARFLRECGYTACVTPTPQPKKRTSRRQTYLPGSNPFNGDWKLCE